MNKTNMAEFLHEKGIKAKHVKDRVNLSIEELVIILEDYANRKIAERDQEKTGIALP